MFKANKVYITLFCFQILIAGSLHAQINETEILTLFTTPQERDLIKAQVVATENEEPEEEKKIEQQEILLSVRLAGVTISQSGQNIAWLNGKAFENGSKLDDGSRVFISSKVKTLVQIKTPDGKYHSVTTGETIDISYFKRIEG